MGFVIILCLILLNSVRIINMTNERIKLRNLLQLRGLSSILLSLYIAFSSILLSSDKRTDQQTVCRLFFIRGVGNLENFSS
jgi:hypothetical protein